MTSIVWRHTDSDSLEHCRISDRGIDGVVVLVNEGLPFRLQYTITFDESWRTQTARVWGWMGETLVRLELLANDGRWTLNGEPQPQVDGCIDIDLGFTPSTNTLPIRRLRLQAGVEQPVAAAWLRFPELTLERLDQAYLRTGETTYRYTSRGGELVGDLEVDANGIVLRYDRYWIAV